MTSNAPRSDASGLAQSKPFTVRDAVIDLMRRLGMTSVFANPGSTELPLFRDFPQDFRYVLGLQEAVVVGMADGYAQATRNASFVNLHSAAGVGNAMGNIFTAFRNRTPIVITAGQQARSILPFDPFLASNQATELPKPYVKWSIEPARAEDVPLAIARAYYMAMQEPRGPVLVSIPVDDWDRAAQPVPARVVSNETRPEPFVLEQIGAALDHPDGVHRGVDRYSGVQYLQRLESGGARSGPQLGARSEGPRHTGERGKPGFDAHGWPRRTRWRYQGRSGWSAWLPGLARADWPPR